MSRKPMSPKAEVWHRTLALRVLKALETMGPLRGYGLARRIEQTRGDRFVLNSGTLYLALLKLEQEGAITGDWGVSDNHRKAKFYGLTPSGRKRAVREIRDWHDATSIIDRFLSPEETS